MRIFKHFFLLLFLLPFIFSVNVISIPAEDCSDYEFIFARGSGQKMNDVDYKEFKGQIKDKLKDQNISFYELGSSKNGYEAIPINFKTALGAYISAGASYEYGESIERGVTELISRIKSESKRCKNKKFVLAGYSQGSQVLDEAIRYINSEKIIYVANFGDPKLYLPEGKTKNACNGIGLSPYRVYVPDCNVREGILSAIKPYQPAGYDNKLGVWCNKNDIVCGSSLNILNPLGGHTSYVSNKNGYEKLASIIADGIKEKSVLDDMTIARYSDSPPRDIVLIFDYQRNYQSYQGGNVKVIEDDLRDKLVELSKHGTRIAIYNSYSTLSSPHRIEEVVDFNDIDLGERIDENNKSKKSIFDYQSYDLYNNVYKAIKYVSKNVKWQEGRERHIFVLTNSVFYYDYSDDGSTYKDAYETAKNNNIKISILSENDNELHPPYKDVTEKTGGELIGNDYSKIILSKNKTKIIQKYYTKTYDINKNSEYTLVVVNGYMYGISKEKSLTITNLDNTKENEVVLISYNKSGMQTKKSIYIYSVPMSTIKTPDTGFSP